MKETIGQIIRKLRKERNMTQEELAEQLGVTFQAVSKWENDTGLPDISQVVPLATVFNVSTDTLFGICGTSNEDETKRIIDEAYSKITSPATQDSIKNCYDILMEGLKKYPNNTALLSNCLEIGISLAYPENDVYDKTNGEAIYKECVRQADIVIKYSKATWDILRAHMIMVLLHSAYGNFDLAELHAEYLPIRSDMTYYSMEAYIAHFKKDLKAENKFAQNDLLLQLEALIDSMVHVAVCYYHDTEYEYTELILNRCFDLIDLMCKEEEMLPNLHHRERGDIYSLLAEVQMKQGKTEEAIESIAKMVNYDLNVLSGFTSETKLKNPIMQYTELNAYNRKDGHIERLLLKLNNPAFATIKNDPRFKIIISKIPVES